MASRQRLSAADREFCTQVAEAAFSNPFSDKFWVLCRAIGSPVQSSAGEQRKAIAQAVANAAARFERAGLGDVQAFDAADRELARRFFLFDAYHRFFSELDALVVEQVKTGDTPLRVPFAKAALALLERRGIARDEALRVFAIFFQIRRAHHFIIDGLKGRSESMEEFRRQLWNSVFTHDIGWYERLLWDRMEDFSTLLLGETGTGKGTAAAAIGRSGFIPFDDRRGTFCESFTTSFVSLNLSQFPETLIESELFGHRKGAFTGAMETHQGVFARCSPHGAIFLDEIGDVPPPVQIKLLQVLQERVFTPVGSHEKLRFRGRVIGATHKPLHSLRASGVFREDFYYRLCSDTITVPPLRQRLREDPAELDDLLQHVLVRLLGTPDPEFFQLVREVIRDSVPRDYPWPGNVRELEQAVRRVLLTRRYVPDTLVAADSGQDLATALLRGELDADALLARYCALLYDRWRNFEEVARRTQLDRRTVKRYLAMGQEPN